MNGFKQSLTLGLLAFAWQTHAASSDSNWNQWRGPNATGVAPNGNPPTEWSETKNIKWKRSIPGEGNATPLVSGDFVYIQTAVPVKKPAAAALPAPEIIRVANQVAPPPANEDRPRPDRPPGGGPGGPGGPGGRRGGGGRGGFGGGGAPTEPFQFTMMALNRADGSIAWQKVLREEIPHEGHHGDGSFASSSPVTDGELLFAYFGSRGLYAMDMKGNVKWQKDLGKMRTKNAFGEGSSPALHGNVLVVNWDHEGEDFILAVDKNTGKELWRKSRDEDTTWSTPLIVQHAGKAQVIVNASSKTRSYDLTTGAEIWSVGPLTANVIPTAVSGNGMVYSMSGFRGAALFAVKLGKTGELTGTDAIVWSRNKDTPYVPSPLLYDDLLYFLKGNDAQLTVLNAHTGKALVEAERLEGVRGVYASPVGAGGRVYIVGRDGGTVVLKKGEKIEVLATNKLDDRFDASPAIVGKEMFLRGKANLYCIAENASK